MNNTVEHFLLPQDKLHKKHFDNSWNYDETYIDFKYDDIYLLTENASGPNKHTGESKTHSKSS